MISGRSGLAKFMLSVMAMRIGADRGQVAPGLDHGLLGAHLGIGRDIARSDVAGHREALLRAVDAHDGRRRRRGGRSVSPITM